MKSYNVIVEFEERVAKFAGATCAVAVDSCTNALFLSCLYYKVKEVLLPCRTYVGVPQAVKNAGGKIIFEDFDWSGVYFLEPYNIVDSARRFKKGMYIKDTLYCLSFHWTKHLNLGNAGMILTDDTEKMAWLKRARFDGRTEGALAKDDIFTSPGYHMIMQPELAVRGLILMDDIKEDLEDLPNDDYTDLSRHKIFKGDYQW